MSVHRSPLCPPIAYHAHFDRLFTKQTPIYAIASDETPKNNQFVFRVRVYRGYYIRYSIWAVEKKGCCFMRKLSYMSSLFRGDRWEGGLENNKIRDSSRLLYRNPSKKTVQTFQSKNTAQNIDLETRLPGIKRSDTGKVPEINLRKHHSFAATPLFLFQSYLAKNHNNTDDIYSLQGWWKTYKNWKLMVWLAFFLRYTRQDYVGGSLSVFVLS